MSTFYVGPYMITPHPQAPMFATKEVATKYFSQVLSEVQSQNPQFNKELTELVRQLGFVSLHFFLSSVLGPFGPYDQLNDAVAIDMCNFRQSDAWMLPGAHAAAFVPRGFFKTTVFTTGGTTWDLLRNPSERAVIVNAISDKALEFFHQVQRNFDSNEFMKILYPEYIPGKEGKVTDKALILPNRRGTTPEPSLRCLGLTGAAEGGHYSLITIDDLVGLEAIDQQRQSNATMETARKWFRTNRRALRLNRQSRIGVVATRYAMDDCYEDIYKSCRTLTGWDRGDLQPDTKGEWDIYYRLVEEDGVYIKPHVMNKQEFETLIQEDFWSAMTQYMNAPTKAGLAEFIDAEVRSAELVWQKEQWYLRRMPDANFDPEEDENVLVPLGACDVVVSTDLAATDTGINARTCRSSIGAWACDSKGNKYRFWSRVGYYSIHQSMEYLFEVNRQFRGYIRTTIVEANAFQKIVKPILEREMDARNEYFAVTAVNAAGDKRARIRAALGQVLPRRQLWLVEGAKKEFLEELRMFPMGNKVDCLDESEKGITYTSRPANSEELEYYERMEERRAHEANNAFGY